MTRVREGEQNRSHLDVIVLRFTNMKILTCFTVEFDRIFEISILMGNAVKYIGIAFESAFVAIQHKLAYFD